MYGLLKPLTTKVQRALVRKQFALIVGDQREAATTEESESDFEIPEAVDEDPVMERLVLGLKKNKTKVKKREVPLDVSLSNITLDVVPPYTRVSKERKPIINLGPTNESWGI